MTPWRFNLQNSDWETTGKNDLEKRGNSQIKRDLTSSVIHLQCMYCFDPESELTVKMLVHHLNADCTSDTI